LYEQPEGDFNMFSLVPHILISAQVACFEPAASPPLPTLDVAGQEHKGHATTSARLDVGWVGPSQSFHVIVHITPDPEWHLYWKNPGVSGAPTEFSIQVPEGFVVGEPQYPRPISFHGEEGVTYGYNEAFAVFIPVTAPSFLEDGQVEFSVTTEWLACKKFCVMGSKNTMLLVSTNNLHQGPPNKDMQVVRWRKSLPLPLDDLQGGESHFSGTGLNITGETQMRPIRFIGIEQQGVRFGDPQKPVLEGEYFRLPIPMHLDFLAFESDTIEVEGLLLFGRKSTDPCYVVQFTVHNSNNQQQSQGDE
jgi:DsbC/DsbD-like thiol-disulfide interchange protein